MRALLPVVAGLLAFSLSLPAEATCSSTPYFSGEAVKKTISAPVTIVAKLIPGITPSVEVTLSFNVDVYFSLDCACSPCCGAGQRQVASFTVYSSIRAFGGEVYFAGTGSASREGKDNPSPNEACIVSAELKYAAGAQFPAFGVDISLGGVTLRMNFSETQNCGCTGNPECFADNPPTVVKVDPPFLELKKGESATVTVQAFDQDGNLAPFSEKIDIAGPPPMVLERTSQVLEKVKLQGKEYVYKGRASYRVVFPKEGEYPKVEIPLSAWDTCNQRNERTVPVFLFYPPKLTPSKTVTMKKGCFIKSSL